MNSLTHKSPNYKGMRAAHNIRQQYADIFLWNYHTNDSAEAILCSRLIKIAESKHGDSYTDINHTTATDTGHFPCTKDADPLVGFDEYKKLPGQHKLQVSWQRHGMEISEILHGEQLAMLCASQLISLLPDMECRLFASRQAADEARHVEFFRAYLPSARLVKFGTDYLAAIFRPLTTELLQQYGNFVVKKALELASSDNHCVVIARQLHWDTHRLRHHLRQRRINKPDLTQQRFRQLTLNIRTTGLMDAALEQRLTRFCGT